ncbi:MAG: peptide-methionine (R)-S-oxide reductase MsrB [Alkalispirochaeta sp.]
MHRYKDTPRKQIDRSIGTGIALMVCAATFGLHPAAAQSQERYDSWEASLEHAGAVTREIRVRDAPWVVPGEMYDPDARIIHDANADVDYPVEFSEAEWRRRLSGERYEVLRRDGTERPFHNALYDNKERGIYYSAATGQPLFHSDDKYVSGTGWPSFTKPISPDAVAYFWDRGFFSRRIEVVDSMSGSHLGHVFTDGPDPTGQRYCMNSAALIFVPEGGTPPPLLTDGR